MSKRKMPEAFVGQIEAEENLVIDVQFALQERIVASKLSRKQVADLAGMTTKRLSRLMSAEGNPDLKTVARLFFVLGKHVKVGLKRHKVALERDESGDKPVKQVAVACSSGGVFFE